MSIRSLDLLNHLRSDRSPFVVGKGSSGPEWKDAEYHQSAYETNPTRYALSSLVDQATAEQRERTLYQLLLASRADFDNDTREVLERVTRILLQELSPERVLTVFLALRRTRANHKHTQRAMMKYLLNHPAIEQLASQRRPAMVDALEHAIGRNVARGCVRRLNETNSQDEYVQRHLLRYAQDEERACQLVAYLYGHSTELTINHDVTLAYSQSEFDIQPERPRTITATNRGDIAATLVHIYRGGDNPELRKALDEYVDEACVGLPRFDGRIALILDASASTEGYGDRQYCCISQSQALRMVLERTCSDLRVITLGGQVDLPFPEGETDLASALIDALETEPDVVAIISDGYENVFDGDLARVVASVSAMGNETPIFFCHSKFTDRDDLSLRRPASQLPEVEFWHQDDFREVLWTLFAGSRSPLAEQFLDQQLRERLLSREKEAQTWIYN